MPLQTSLACSTSAACFDLPRVGSLRSRGRPEALHASETRFGERLERRLTNASGGGRDVVLPAEVGMSHACALLPFVGAGRRDRP